MDSRLATTLSIVFRQGLELLTIIGIGFYISPFVGLSAMLLLICAIWVGRRYLAGSREVRRLASGTMGSVVEHLGSTLAGMSTIRTSGRAPEYITQMYRKIDAHASASSQLELLDRWMSLRQSMIGTLFTAVVVVSIILLDMNAALAGLALTYALRFSQILSGIVRQYANLEAELHSLERVLEYSHIDVEDLGGEDAPAAWPTQARLEFDSFSANPSPDSDHVLKDVSFTVEPGQRVGVVSRTEDDKSSLVHALFRFIEASTGRVLVDGLDISCLKLQQLRSRIAIVPQDLGAFSGTVRSNLDPFDRFSDNELQNAIKRVRTAFLDAAKLNPPVSGELSPVAASASAPIEPPSNSAAELPSFTSFAESVHAGGCNLSVGQRRLLCYARVLVQRPRLVVLEETAATVDAATNLRIQRSIRDPFEPGTTMLVVAHRLSSVADLDKILVLGEGRLLEYGGLAELYARENGVFRALVEESPEQEALKKMFEGVT